VTWQLLDSLAVAGASACGRHLMDT
jgi:hypothetical protein